MLWFVVVLVFVGCFMFDFLFCFVYMGIMLFCREVHGVLPSLCWIKCQLQS